MTLWASEQNAELIFVATVTTGGRRIFPGGETFSENKAKFYS